jgi:hypothetical protein
MTLTELLSEIAEAIQSVKGDKTPIKAENFAKEIKNLKLNNGNSNSGLINSTTDMQTLTVQIKVSNNDYSAIYTGFDNPNTSGEINSMKFEDIYTKFKNGQLLIKLQDDNRAFDVVDVMYDKRINYGVTTYINKNTARNDTTVTEALVLSTAPFNYYDVDLYEYIDGSSNDIGYVNTQDTNLSGLTLGFVHGEVLEYGEEYESSGGYGGHEVA